MFSAFFRRQALRLQLPHQRPRVAAPDGRELHAAQARQDVQTQRVVRGKQQMADHGDIREPKKELGMSVAYDDAAAAAAKTIGLGRSTIEKAAYADDLTVHYLGRKPLVLVDDLRDWIASLLTERTGPR